MSAHWVYRRWGSGPEFGYELVELPYEGATHGRSVARLGDGPVALFVAEYVCAAANGLPLPPLRAGLDPASTDRLDPVEASVFRDRAVGKSTPGGWGK